FPAIAPAKDHIAQLQFGKTLLGTFLQRLDSLDREHPLHQLRQYGGLVTGAGADFQHLVQRARGQQQLTHARDHEWLRDGLVMANGQRGIFIGTMRQRPIDEQVTRRATDDFQHMRVRQPLLVETLNQAITGALRGHPGSVAHQTLLYKMVHSTPSTQSPMDSNASWKLRSSCSGVIET